MVSEVLPCLICLQIILPLVRRLAERIGLERFGGFPRVTQHRWAPISVDGAPRGPGTQTFLDFFTGPRATLPSLPQVALGLMVAETLSLG
jgi:hypothetical protein